MMKVKEALEQLDRLRERWTPSIYDAAIKQQRRRKVDTHGRPSRDKWKLRTAIRLHMRQNGTCLRCGEPLGPIESINSSDHNIDHRDVTLKGAKYNSITNKALMHRTCNLRKSSRNWLQESKRTGRLGTELI